MMTFTVHTSKKLIPSELQYGREQTMVVPNTLNKNPTLLFDRKGNCASGSPNMWDGNGFLSDEIMMAKKILTKIKGNHRTEKTS